MTRSSTGTPFRTSRRRLVQGAAAGFTVAQLGFLRSVASQSDAVQKILDDTVTTERFGVTFLGSGLQANNDGLYDIPWPEQVVAIVRAARAQEQFHLEAFEAAGGVSQAESFTVPPETLTSQEAFFAAVVEQETAETAHHIAAMRVFAELGRPDLAKVAFQYAAEEAEHRLLANYTLGTRPANDVAFSIALFDSPDEFLVSLEERGIIGGTGTEIVFPGPGQIYTEGVIETEPGGVEVDCAPGATPEVSPVASPVS